MGYWIPGYPRNGETSKIPVDLSRESKPQRTARMIYPSLKSKREPPGVQRNA